MVREYVNALYVPAAASSRALADADGFGPAPRAGRLEEARDAAWPQVRIEHVESEPAGPPGSGWARRWPCGSRWPWAS